MGAEATGIVSSRDDAICSSEDPLGQYGTETSECTCQNGEALAC